MDRMKVLNGHIRSEDVADGNNLDLPLRKCARHYCESHQGSSCVNYLQKHQLNSI